MAGLQNQLSAGAINTALGTIARDLNNTFDKIQQAQNFLQQNSDADLAAAPISMAPQDVTALRAAFDDLDSLRRIYRGQDALPTAKDFRANARKISGLGFL